MLKSSKELLVTSLKFPGDVLLGEMLLSFSGRGSLLVENYRTIVLYSDTLIKLQGKNYCLLIHGTRLSIEYYNQEEMKIAGQIQSVEFK